MKLKTHLRETSLERLQGIARFWDLYPPEESIATDPAALADHLYPRMQTPGNFRATFEKLEGREREWVYFLALHGGELPLDEFRRRARFPDNEAMLAATERLADRGFFWRERVRDSILSVDLVGIPEPFVRLIELPPYWQGFLGFHLESLGTDELKNIAKNTLDERLPTRKKQALVHYLRKKLLNPKTLQTVLARRDPMQLEMFQQILQRNGVCAWKDLLDSGVHKKFDHARADRLRDLVENSGLVFIIGSAPNKYNNLLMAPRDLAYIIQNNYARDERSLDELSHAGGDHGADHEPSPRPGVILDNSNNILRDLVIFCAFIQRGSVKMLNNGGLGRNDLKKIVPLLSYNKTVKYVAFLALFAMARKLIIAVGDTWRTSSTLVQWLSRGQECYRDLYEFWLTTNEWNEEYIDGDVVHADNYPQNLISATELRKLILRMLEKTPADQWIDFETFAESLLPQVAIEIPGRFDLIPSEKFNRHPILIMESVLAETLYWLGVVMLGVSDQEIARQLGSRANESIAPYDPTHPVSLRMMGEGQFMFFFRLTDFGRQLLARPYLDVDKLFSRKPEPDLTYAESTDFFTVQPNLEIVTPPDLNLEKCYRLLEFTDIKKVDIMTTLSISRDSVRAGMDHGLTAEAIIRLLSECSRKELPETVRQMITECEVRHGEVDMGLAGGYIKVSDRLHLEEMRANSKIAPAIKDIFDDRLILLSRTADFKKIARELQRMGFMPSVDSDSLYVTNEGLFQVTLRAEELYDLLAVILFAIMMEEDAETTLFEDRIRPLYQRLANPAQERFNPKFYAESIAKTFFSNYEKMLKKYADDSTRKFRKQINRLISQVPRTRGGSHGFKGENPTGDPAEIQRMIKYAIEHEAQMKIHYIRSTGNPDDLVIEPEALQDKKVYAYCPKQDEHHVFALDRIENAAI
ncbi:MAG: helicase-associated domain-containing protein [bacterium]|nr:helicase-associated domain-containing protein [bacterium]